MNLLHLRYACEVERCGSINQAAKNLYLSQPYLSSCLQSLERSVNVTLFRRSSKGVVPTEQGREFLRMAKALLEQADCMERRYSKSAPDTHLFQVIGIRTVVILRAYLRYYEQYLSCLPHCESGYYEASFEDVIDGVHCRAFSLGLLMYYTNQRGFIEHYARLRDLRFVEIGSVPLCAVFSRTLPIRDRKTISAADVRGLPYVTYSDFKHSILDLENECRLIGMELPDKLLYVHDRHSLMNTLNRTGAFTLAQRFTPADEEKYNLISVPVKNEQSRVHFGYLYPAGAVFAPDSSEQNFIRIYRETLLEFV